MKQICICGGGAIGHVLAAVLGSREDCKINIFTQQPHKWKTQICVQDNSSKTYVGKLACISNKAEDVIPQSDVIILCLPGFLIQDCLLNIKHLLKENSIIGSVVSSTGFFLFAHKILNNKTQLFGFQRVPYISRICTYGSSAQLLGYKKQLAIAVENIVDAPNFVSMLADWLNTPIILLENYWEVTLTNSNPILHPARLYGMWHNWSRESTYNTNALFYADWDNFSSEVLIKCDNELQALLDVLPVNRKNIPTILSYYESNDAQSLTNKIRSIEAFKSIPAPMLLKNRGYIPDLSSRYFTEDIPFGLLIIKSIAVSNKILSPTIDKIITWAQRIMEKEYMINGALIGKDYNLFY